MSNDVTHILGVSGGKDSAALAIYLNRIYPQLKIKYYFCDTEKELKETYDYIKVLEDLLGAEIELLKAAPDASLDQFDHFLKLYGNYLPSPTQRWCTKKMKLDPFEKYVGTNPTLSYVAIRGDENREGYVSQKQNIQTVFPFRQNIWSAEIINLVLENKNITLLSDLASSFVVQNKLSAFHKLISKELSKEYQQEKKLKDLLNFSVVDFNLLVYNFLKGKDYPVSLLDDYPLLYDTNIVDREGVFKILEDSGAGLPKYYKKIEFEVDGEKGNYFRTRSGCFFCFYQQKIEWVWLYENHPDLFAKAVDYEKEGYTWMQDEKLEDLVKEDRLREIKKNHLKNQNNAQKTSKKLIDQAYFENEEQGCLACFL